MTQKAMKDTKVHDNFNRKQNSRPFHVKKVKILEIDKNYFDIKDSHVSHNRNIL